LDRRATDEGEGPQLPPRDPMNRLLLTGKLGAVQLMPTGSNYTFLVPITGASGERCRAVYKPKAGEAPLWDFPDGTLYMREYASYLVSQALGWDFIPPTVVREGPHGIGSVQLFVESKKESHYFSIRESHTLELQRIAVFDCLVNNADRKAAHCFEGQEGKVWSVDHGLTFHPEHKLRTVIWDWAGLAIPDALVEDLKGLSSRFSQLKGLLGPCLSEQEIQVLESRLRRLIDSPLFPRQVHGWRNTPWPLF